MTMATKVIWKYDGQEEKVKDFEDYQKAFAFQRNIVKHKQGLDYAYVKQI